MFSITGMSVTFSVHCPKEWFQFLVLKLQPDMWGKNTGRLFKKKPQAQQNNPVGFISLQGFLKQLKTLAVSLLESAAKFPMGYHSSPVLVQGRADWSKEVNTFNHSRSQTCYIFSQSSMKASCPCQKKQQGHFRALHSTLRSGRGLAQQQGLEGRKLLPTANHL